MDRLVSTLAEKGDAIDEGVPNPRGESLSKLSIAFTCLSALFVGLRFTTRLVNSSLGVDDGLITASLVFTIGMMATYNKEASNGFGMHAHQVSKAHQITAFKWFFAAQILYKIATCCTKLSIGMMYLRIFPGRRFRVAVWSVMAITVTYTLVAVLLTVFSCNPIDKAWNKFMPGTCLASRSIWYSTSIMILLTDIMVIALSINEIRRLQLPLVKKMLLCGLLSLGVFVIACTVYRMITVSPRTTAADQIYYQAISNSWTFVETNVGIICACLPVLKVPLTRQLRVFLGLRRKGTTKSDTVPSYPLGTIGNISSRGRRPDSELEGDSVEDLIVNSPGGIKVTSGFSTRVTDMDQYPSWKVGG
ncbi:integral membrane protein [Coniochaeta sp. 2T2.1]|nr:integral membrane protein [Coniochaeta sp. 2T2.1]